MTTLRPTRSNTPTVAGAVLKSMVASKTRVVTRLTRRLRLRATVRKRESNRRRRTDRARMRDEIGRGLHETGSLGDEKAENGGRASILCCETSRSKRNDSLLLFSACSLYRSSTDGNGDTFTILSFFSFLSVCHGFLRSMVVGLEWSIGFFKW